MIAELQVLLVEDDALIAEVLVEALEDAGFRVQAVGDAAAAAGILCDPEQGFDALVTDINLGAGLDGWELAKLGRGQSPDLGIVYMSGYGDAGAGKRVEPSVVIQKPFTPLQLATVVERLVGGRRGSTGDWTP